MDHCQCVHNCVRALGVGKMGVMGGAREGEAWVFLKAWPRLRSSGVPGSGAQEEKRLPSRASGR